MCSLARSCEIDKVICGIAAETDFWKQKGNKKTSFEEISEVCEGWWLDFACFLSFAKMQSLMILLSSLKRRRFG